jgi:hypothetical protein
MTARPRAYSGLSALSTKSNFTSGGVGICGEWVDAIEGLPVLNPLVCSAQSSICCLVQWTTGSDLAKTLSRLPQV